MKKHFHTTRQVIKTEVDAFTVEQLRQLLERKKPSVIYHGQWSEKMAFIEITEYNNKGFKMRCNGWADKTPQQFNAASLHSFLKFQGLVECYIKLSSEQNPEECDATEGDQGTEAGNKNNT